MDGEKVGGGRGYGGVGRKERTGLQGIPGSTYGFTFPVNCTVYN
jgi:hypothetical protein